MQMRPKLKHITAGTILMAVFFFQNCTQTPDNSSSLNSYQSELPFAYQAQPDTIAYMSCSGITDNSFNPDAYFTFRVGAYNNTTGGLTMTPEFFQATQYYQTADRATALTNSTFNSGAFLQLSIRPTRSYQSMWTGGNGTLGGDFDVFLPQLDSPDIGPELAGVPQGLMMNYFPGQGTQRLMEASVRFMEAGNVEADTRNNLISNQYMLVAGYTSTADPTDQALRSMVDYNFTNTTYANSTNNSNSVFGVGYRVGFSLPAGGTSGDPRTLSTITEMNLSTNYAVLNASWSCNSKWQFEIIRPEDLQTVANPSGVIPPSECNPAADPNPATLSSVQQSQLYAIRRVLHVEDWFVDLVHQCVIPKNTGDYCYGGSTFSQSGATISYGLASCSDTATTVCPHYVSVCIRN